MIRKSVIGLVTGSAMLSSESAVAGTVDTEKPFYEIIEAQQDPIDKGIGIEPPKTNEPPPKLPNFGVIVEDPKELGPVETIIKNCGIETQSENYTLLSPTPSCGPSV